MTGRPWPGPRRTTRSCGLSPGAETKAPGAGGGEPHGAYPEFDPEVRPAELVVRNASLVVGFVPFSTLVFGPEQWPVTFLLPENATIRLFDFLRCGTAFEERVFVLERPGQQKGVDGLEICDVVV